MSSNRKVLTKCFKRATGDLNQTSKVISIRNSSTSSIRRKLNLISKSSLFKLTPFLFKKQYFTKTILSNSYIPKVLVKRIYIYLHLQLNLLSIEKSYNLTSKAPYKEIKRYYSQLTPFLLRKNTLQKYTNQLIQLLSLITQNKSFKITYKVKPYLTRNIPKMLNKPNKSLPVKRISYIDNYTLFSANKHYLTATSGP
jgi:hypothetical protein